MKKMIVTCMIALVGNFGQYAQADDDHRTCYTVVEKHVPNDVIKALATKGYIPVYSEFINKNSISKYVNFKYTIGYVYPSKWWNPPKKLKLDIFMTSERSTSERPQIYRNEFDFETKMNYIEEDSELYDYQTIVNKYTPNEVSRMLAGTKTAEGFIEDVVKKIESNKFLDCQTASLSWY